MLCGEDYAAARAEFVATAKYKLQLQLKKINDCFLPKITKYAIYSRLVVLFIQFIFNYLISDHNPGDVFISPAYHKLSQADNIYDKIVFSLFGGLIRWDAHYFLHISLYGYTHENTTAFFPLFPIFISIVGSYLHLLLPFFSVESIHLLTAILINFIFFVLAARKLYFLTCKILGSLDMAYYATILFCINPASIFFTAPYSETLFAFFTFCGIFEKNKFWSAIFFSLSAATRSNGILNVAFILYKLVKSFIRRCVNNEVHAKSILKYTFDTIFLIIICCLPFLLFEFYVYFKFCISGDAEGFDPEILKYVKSKRYILTGSKLSGMCAELFPIPYMYVQNHYWNVGFLKYFQFKQIWNFILVIPLVSTIFGSTYYYFQYCESLFYDLVFGKIVNVDDIKKQNLFVGYFTHKSFQYIIHALCLTIFCFFCIHVQVTTRMIASSCPSFYWCSAFFMMYRIGRVHQDYECVSTILIIAYFVGYGILGVILFSNFYPWT